MYDGSYLFEFFADSDILIESNQVANGDELPLKQEEVPLHGHAVEARIYAEDPYGGFLPCAGPLVYFDMPEETSDVRVETGNIRVTYLVQCGKGGLIHYICEMQVFARKMKCPYITIQ